MFFNTVEVEKSKWLHWEKVTLTAIFTIIVLTFIKRVLFINLRWHRRTLAIGLQNIKLFDEKDFGLNWLRHQRCTATIKGKLALTCIWVQLYYNARQNKSYSQKKNLSESANNMIHIIIPSVSSREVTHTSVVEFFVVYAVISCFRC